MIFNICSFVDFAGLLACLPAEEDSHTPLPCLDTHEEQTGRDEHSAPFLVNRRMLEHYCVEGGNIDQGEQSNKTGHNSPNEELVAPYINRPLGGIAFRVGLHAKEGTAHVNHFPCQEQSEPC